MFINQKEETFMNLWQGIKKAFNDWCARMEKSNKETFGSGTPDCCKLNQKQQTGQRK